MKQILLAVLLVAMASSCFFNCWKLPPHNYGPLNCKPTPQPQPAPQPPLYHPQPQPQPVPQPPIYQQPPPRPQIETNRFILSFEFAAREGRCLDDSRGNVLWNGYVVYSIKPCDYEIHPVSIEVKSEGEDNTLEFEGAGASNSYGVTIDNVRLVRKGTSRDLVVNGGFERPCQNGGWHTYDRIEGWEGTPLEIGGGKLYNCRWNSQVAELDSDNNYRLTQRFHFEEPCY